MVAHAPRCRAGDASGRKNRRKLASGKFLCGFHERHLAKKAAGALEGPPALSLMAPLSAPNAQKLLEEMRAALPGTKSQLLSKLNAAPQSCKLQFVYDGGLEILEKWIRRHPPLRKDILALLKDGFPVTGADLKKAKLRDSLEALGSEGENEDSKELLARWQSEGLFSVPASKPPPKGGACLLVAETPSGGGSPSPELQQLHPRIAEFLASRPLLLKFLKAQPGFLSNLNSRSVALLVRLEKARLSASAAVEVPDAANRTVKVTGLGEDAEDDVQWLLQKLREWNLKESKQGVELPRESHSSKPCKTVYIRLGSEREARLAARCLHDRCRPSDDEGSVASKRFHAEVMGLGTSISKKVRFEDDRCRVLLCPADGESVEYLSLRLDQEPMSLRHEKSQNQKALT
ncbi:pks3, partial [Symbiodinium microadriaticum]